ncbi:MAG TPA: MFS transporter [Actinophytocola sp.]|uniref:MFS transporter n=1 Tax=Actinophytocola sp. TaxID=1872138 RepID=UPI002F923A46
MALFGGFLVAPSSRPVAVCLIVAVLMLAGFAVRQRAAASPLLDLAVQHNRTFIWSQLTISLVNLGWTGLLFLLPTYFLVVRGFSALGVALLLVPLAGMASVGSVVTNRLTHRLGVRWTVIIGLLVFAARLGLLSTLTPRSGLPLVVVALALSGFGAGLPQAPALVTALGALPERSAANGPGVVSVLRHIGGAFGVAAGGFVVATAYLRGLPEPGAPPALADAAARASVVNVADAADRVRTSAYAAFTHGVAMAMLGGAVLFVGLAVLAMALSERPSQQDDRQATP